VDAELARTNSNSGGPARLNDDSRSGGFDGLKMAEAREKVLEKLKELGLLEKEEEFTHNVAKCYRCASTIEPMLSKQWFVNMKPLAEKAIKAIKAGEVKYTPERWQKISLDWLQNIHDWCISRNIWWGHKIPIEGSEFTFDTWFSSALWPFATLGWPEKTESLKEYYPTNVISSARDILHLWISRMIFSGLEFMGDVPFKQVIIHSTVQAADGRRMSKSLGTGIDPLVLIEKYGADATRFGLIFQEFGGQEIRFNEQNIMMGKKFANKLWNIARFVMTKTHSTGSTGSPQGSSGQALRQGSGRAGGKISEVGGENFSATKLDDSDKTILAKLEETKKAVSKNIEDYKFGETAHILYDFIWHDFADKYIEESKSKIGEEINAILSHILINSLKMLHPFMPFITEEIWSYLGQEDLLMVAEWPAR
jgi:valyl-tRNA synthetase